MFALSTMKRHPPRHQRNVHIICKTDAASIVMSYVDAPVMPFYIRRLRPLGQGEPPASFHNHMVRTSSQTEKATTCTPYYEDKYLPRVSKCGTWPAQ